MFRGAYANNVKCMYTSAGGDNVDCSEFMWNIYTNIDVLYLHINICGIYVAFEGHVCCWQICGISMLNKSCSFLLLSYLYVQKCVVLVQVTVAVELNTYIQCGIHVFRAYANNVKCMYTRIPVHIDDCNVFILGIYTDNRCVKWTWPNWHVWIVFGIWGAY